MSGSPVYIDGRLIGAVSYALGSFSKEPIAGITPIEEMTTATDGVRRPVPVARLDFPMSRQDLVAAFSRALHGTPPFVDRPDDARLLGTTGVAGFGSRELGAMLRPIATPLVMAGFDADVAETLSAAFQNQGFVPTGAGAGTRPGEMPFEGPLKPGDAVGVTFVSGDFLLGATGTVTHIDGDRVYAFGHPMYNLGPTAFPMTRAYVYTLLPSLFSSSKLAITGEVIGTLLQDRPTAVSGRLGPGPRLIPVTLDLESAHTERRTFRFDVVQDQLFTPLMTYSALLNTLLAYEREMGAATYEVSGRVIVDGQQPLTFANLFAGDAPGPSAASYIVSPLTALLGNMEAPVDLSRIDLTIKTEEQPRTATLERVWIDDPRPRPGRTVPLKVLLKTYRGEDVLTTVPVTIPAHARGTVSFLVTDGARLTQTEQREARLPQPTRTVEQIIKAFGDVRKNNILYVKLLASQPGAAVQGQIMPALPPSVLAVHDGDRAGGASGSLPTATLGEWEIATTQVVNGTRTLAVPLSTP
jgi:hypothetical protein